MTMIICSTFGQYSFSKSLKMYHNNALKTHFIVKYVLKIVVFNINFVAIGKYSILYIINKLTRNYLVSNYNTVRKRSFNGTLLNWKTTYYFDSSCRRNWTIYFPCTYFHCWPKLQCLFFISSKTNNILGNKLTCTRGIPC